MNTNGYICSRIAVLEREEMGKQQERGRGLGSVSVWFRPSGGSTQNLSAKEASSKVFPKRAVFYLLPIASGSVSDTDPIWRSHFHRAAEREHPRWF